MARKIFFHWIFIGCNWIYFPLEIDEHSSIHGPSLKSQLSRRENHANHLNIQLNILYYSIWDLIPWSTQVSIIASLLRANILAASLYNTVLNLWVNTFVGNSLLNTSNHLWYQLMSSQALREHSFKCSTNEGEPSHLTILLSNLLFFWWGTTR